MASVVQGTLPACSGNRTPSPYRSSVPTRPPAATAAQAFQLRLPVVFTAVALVCGAFMQPELSGVGHEAARVRRITVDPQRGRDFVGQVKAAAVPGGANAHH